MASNIKGITIEIGGDTTELSKALTKVNGSSRSLQSELKQVDKLLKFDSGNVTLCAQKQDLLTEAVAATEEKLHILENAEKQVQEQFARGEVSKEQYRALQREIEKTKNDLGKYETELEEAKKASSQLDQTADELGKEMDDLGEEVKDAGNSADDAAGDFTVMKGALADMVADGVEAAGEAIKDMVGVQEQASNQFQAATGIATESMAKYNDAIEAIYKNNFGESLQDVAEKMALVKQATGELDPSKLQTMTENLYTLEDTFGMDFSETIRGVQALMNHFGISAEEAFDLMSTGAQNGLNYTDELGDNVSEYSGKFAEAGYSAQDYFQLLQNGCDGGAYNLDKVNDAINEVTTRLADGTIEEGIGGFSDKTQDLFNAWKNGGATQKEVIDSIVADIQNTTGEQEKMNLAALAFGTMAEDGGTKFVESLTSVGNSFDDVKGKMDEVKQIKYDDVKSELAGVGRTVQMEVLAPIVSDLMPAIKEVVEFIASHVPEITAIIAGFVAAFAIVKIAGILTSIVGAISAVITAVQAGIPVMAALNAVLAVNPVILIVAAIAALVVAFITLWNTSDSFRQFWLDLWETVKNACQVAWEAISTFFTETIPQIINNIITWFQELPGKIAEFFTQILTNLLEWGANMLQTATDTVTQIITAIVQFFSELPYKIGYAIGFTIGKLIEWGANMASWVATNIPIIINNIITFFAQLPGKIWNWLVDAFNKLVTWGGNMRQKAGEAASNTINSIIQFFTQLPGKIWSWLLNTIQKVAQWGSDLRAKGAAAARELVSAVISGVTGLPGRMAEVGRNIVQGVWNGISNAAGWFKSQVKSFFSGIVDGVKGALGIHSPSRVFAKEVGQYIPPGIGQGMEDAMPQLMEDTESALQDYANKVGATTKVKLGVDAESVGDMVSGSRIVSPQSLSMSAQQRNTERVAGNTFTQNVNITSNRELSPAETARQTRIATRQMIAAIARG